MQKLIFRNANGVEVDLTSGDFGITDWKGFSDVSLNLQTQQVPFQDGSVYLDGLLGNREISVTLAVNDNNDLEKRYELRRNLIEILNPKLGEGTLIYKNDYLMRQIKGVPLLPVFKNKNSNDRETLKASLAWTCPNPYWEDVEETRIHLTAGARQAVRNDGDVPCQVKVDLFTNGVTNPQIKNFTENKKIHLNGTFTNGININTNVGEKSVSTEELEFKLSNFGSALFSITYSESLGLFVAVGYSGTILTSTDGITWISRTSGTSQFLYSVTYSESLGLFVAVGNGGTILTSTDGITWNDINGSIKTPLNSVLSVDSLNLFIAVGYSNQILLSGFTLYKNLISSLSADSDMTLSLEKGNNDILLNRTSGSLSGQIRYRQKYIGV